MAIGFVDGGEVGFVARGSGVVVYEYEAMESPGVTYFARIWERLGSIIMDHLANRIRLPKVPRHSMSSRWLDECGSISIMI